jgi:spermidine/putrescine-binding protein
MIDQNMIQAVDMERLPNFADTYPVFREAAWTRRDGRQYAMPAYFGFDVINYNADLIEAPTTWDVLIDPQYKGKVGMHDSLGTMFFIGVVLGYGGDGATYTQDQLAAIVDWGKQWKANSLTILTSYGEMTDLLVRGDLWLAALGWEYVTVQGKAQGANLAHVLPPGPAKCWVDSYVLFTDAPNVNNAYGWLNNTFSPSVMAQSSQNLSSFVSNPKAVEEMPAEHAESMNFASMQEQLDRAVFAFFPPTEVSDPNMITLDELLAAWEEIKAA